MLKRLSTAHCDWAATKQEHLSKSPVGVQPPMKDHAVDDVQCFGICDIM